MSNPTQLSEDLQIILEQDLELDNPKLHLAIAAGDLNQVREYTLAGDSLEEMGLYGSTPLEIAARHGHLEIIRLLVQLGANVNPVDYGTSTPLHEAAFYGHREAVLFLIQSGADVNSVIEDDETPLNYIASTGKLEIAELLIQAGAEVNTLDRYGMSAIVKAARSKNQQLFEYLSTLVLEEDKHQAQIERFIVAIKEGNLSDVTMYISSGTNVNAFGIENWTGLMHSASRNQVLIGQKLIAEGADLNLADETGKTALMIAEEEGHNNFVRLLLEAGATH